MLHSRFAQCHWNTKESPFCASSRALFQWCSLTWGWAYHGDNARCFLWKIGRQLVARCFSNAAASNVLDLPPFPFKPPGDFPASHVWWPEPKKVLHVGAHIITLAWRYWLIFPVRSTATHDNYVSPKKQAALPCCSWKPNFIPFPGPSSHSSAWSLTVCPFCASIERPTLPWIASVECQPSSWLASWRWWKRGGHPQ